ncbi:MAG: hypothetical protein ACI4JM_09720 [Oscillospiraceae bacterium]
MEKTLSMGAFTELDEREVMKTEGGMLYLLGLCIYETVQANNAKKAAEQAYNTQRQNLINQINDNPTISSSVPKSSIEYFNIHGIDGGSKGVTGGVY